MSARSARLLPVLAVLAIATAACGQVAPSPAPPSPTVAPAAVPSATPVPSRPPATPAPTPAQTPAVGNVDGDAGGPVLSIEQLDADTIRATVVDPAAKAWRITVAGTGELGGDRWDIVAETGDVAPAVSATEIHDGARVDKLDLSGFWDQTAVTGGCHATLPVCIESSGLEIPEGEGRFSVRLELPEGQVPLVIRGASASWPGEPFILGPWTETAAFPWGEG